MDSDPYYEGIFSDTKLNTLQLDSPKAFFLDVTRRWLLILLLIFKQVVHHQVDQALIGHLKCQVVEELQVCFYSSYDYH